MNILKFINLYYKIKSLFVYLPKGIQEDVVDDLEDVYELCIISKYEKERRK